MCGILAVFSRTRSPIKISKSILKCIKHSRELAYLQSMKQRHRGPDHTGIIHLENEGVILIQERLSVLCIETGNQPLQSIDGNVLLTTNGEIYNYLELCEYLSELNGKKFIPRSDCDVIIGLYEKFGEKLLTKISGMFAFVLYDRKLQRMIVARDPIGIIPLYEGIDDQGNLWISSEMKCLIDVCDKINVFPPGTALIGPVNQLRKYEYYLPNWMIQVPVTHVNLQMLKEKLISAVRSHLQCDVKFGALLSGGVDSSIIAAIATKILRETNPNYRLQTYSIGLENAPDFKYSKMVAQHINSEHHELKFNIEDGIDCIREIIYYTETYDVTTVRCSIPMLILSRFIRSNGIKMILSGEGADELFGGYLYFFNAPTTNDFHFELVNRVRSLHYSDCLRANKTTMAWGLELRVPFLDTAVIDYVMQIRPEDKIPGEKNLYYNDDGKNEFATSPAAAAATPASTKLCIEKYILRKAFSDDNYLPDEILWRQKEQFSDGVGYNWIDSIREYAADQISDEEFTNADKLYPCNTPATKEAFYYRKIFHELFPIESYAETVKRWIPRTDWGCSADPSGRAQKVHVSLCQ